MAGLPQEGETPVGFGFLKPNLSLLSPLSLSGAKRFLHLLFIGKYCLSILNHHVNRRLELETCCEINKCKNLCKIAILPRRGQRN